MLRCFRLTGAILINVLIMTFFGMYLPGSVLATDGPQKLVNHQGGLIDTEVQLDVGYRRDNLDWNIAGNSSGTNPNILSELEWSDLEIIQVRLEGRAFVNKKIYFRGYLDYGWIYDGQNRDSDYSGDNRTGEFSRSVNTSDDDAVWDGSIGLGWVFTFGTSYCKLAPMLGYSIHKQNLRITDGNQVIPPTGPFPGLDSTYKSRWHGPWIGFDLIFSTPPDKQHGREMRFLLNLEYHWADYYAEADWNLRTGPVNAFEHPKSFEHEANGSGIVTGAKWLFGIKPGWDFSLGLQYQKWQTDTGTDRVFFAGGTYIDPPGFYAPPGGLTSETMLNEVNWESFDIMAGLTYRF